MSGWQRIGVVLTVLWIIPSMAVDIMHSITSGFGGAELARGAIEAV
jgi:hypothetical protein